MRLVGWFFVLLMVLGWLAAELPLDGTSSDGRREEVSRAGHPPGVALQDDWRRTRDGWERRSWWTPKSPVRRPALHPMVVVLLEVFLTLGALIAFSAAKEQRQTKQP